MQKLSNSGFTLIEIIIVLVIIAVMSSVVMLNVGSSNYSGYIGNVNKIAATLGLLGDEAVYTNSVVTCSVANSGFTCQAYKNGEWNDLNLAKVASWGWPKGMAIEAVMVNGAPLKENEEIRFYPTGELSPMSFKVTNGIYHSWIDGNVNGDFAVSN